MKKRFFSFLLVLALVAALLPTAAFAEEAEVDINEANFPDSTFRTYVQDMFDLDDSGSLSQAERDAVTVIDVSGKGISNMSGIAYFANLLELYCGSNQLTDLDVSRNTSLLFLACDNNQLTALDISQNTALIFLSCMGNQLSSIDVSQQPGLQELWANENQLTSLDVTQNPFLTALACGKKTTDCPGRNPESRSQNPVLL